MHRTCHRAACPVTTRRVGGACERPATARLLAIASIGRAPTRRCSDVGTTPIVPTLGLFRPEGRPTWSATGFAGTRSEQSGSSADAAAHHVGVNDRAHDQAEHDRMHLLGLMRSDSLDAHAEYDPSIEKPPPAATRPRDRYSLSLTVSDCSDLLASVALAGWADSGTGRNNHDLGTIGVRSTRSHQATNRTAPQVSSVPTVPVNSAVAGHRARRRIGAAICPGCRIP